ncbi:MAG: exonuclease SbcCD subunit D C-terminal domain-containing protein [Planctomycetes bacterium]|nr:exonuclease SbcCD subunit D C-terminal domain-containing protein [Planctomycetota bacterium]
MRILHTADWHLGHSLRDHSRQAEHDQFLAWLVQTLAEREVDALLLAGDVFDSANPPPWAWRQWFQFLGAARTARPGLQIVAIAGNHDSAARLDAPRELLAPLGVRVVGVLPRSADGAVAPADLLVPLRDRDGRPAALVAAIPFLRGGDVAEMAPGEATPADDRIPRPGDGEAHDAVGDRLFAGMRALHERIFATARAERQLGQALVALAHGYFTGGQTSELSERKVLGGNQHALPLDLFPEACDYVALGHLHRPQRLGGREHVRYSGSPLPLAMPEREYPHHVVFADFAAGALQKVWSLRVPRPAPLLRLPEHGELLPDAALAAVAALPARDPLRAEGLRPLLEVAVRLPEPSPALAERIAQACADKDVRLVRVELLAGGVDAAASAAPVELASLSPEQVFVRRYQRVHAGPVPESLLGAFRELLEAVEHGEPA